MNTVHITENQWKPMPYVCCVDTSEQIEFSFMNTSKKEHKISETLLYRQQTDYVPFVNTDTQYNWIFLTFLGVFFLYSLITIIYYNFFKNIYNSIVSYQASLLIFREKSVQYSRAIILGKFTTLFSFSLILSIFFLKKNISIIEFYNFEIFLFWFAVFSSVHLLRYLFLIVIKYISKATELINLFNYTLDQFFVGLGLALFLLSFMLQYGTGIIPSTVLIIIALTLALYEIFKIFRLTQIFLEKHISFLFLILYLCGLEIFPYLIIIKSFNVL